MIRAALAEGAQSRDDGFRHRGTEVSRVEALSDAVFGFGITLLVMSVEPPTSYADLIDSFRGLPAFAACFALLAWLWHVHFVFCRRFGLTDPRFVILNTVFLFLVVFYMYPLKFVFVGFTYWLTGMVQQRYVAAPGMSAAEVSTLFVIYGLGFTLVTGVIAMMHAHALSLRRSLALNDHEAAATRLEIVQNLLRALVGLICAGIASLVSARYVGLSGFAFMLLGPFEAIGGILRARLRQRFTPAAAPPG